MYKTRMNVLAPLGNCCGFVDGTVRPICWPGSCCRKPVQTLTNRRLAKFFRSTPIPMKTKQRPFIRLQIKYGIFEQNSFHTLNKSAGKFWLIQGMANWAGSMYNCHKGVYTALKFDISKFYFAPRQIYSCGANFTEQFTNNFQLCQYPTCS